MKLNPEDRPDCLDFIHDRVRGIQPYTLSAARADIKVNQNENPFDFPVELKERVFERLRTAPWSRYPEFSPRTLLEKIARRFEWPPEGVLVGNGSNEIIQATFLVTLDSTRRLLVPQPTFTLYGLVAGILGAAVTEVPLSDDLRFDIEALCRAVAHDRPDVVVVCSPNNPTGCQLSRDEVRQLLESHRGLLVLDEAYCEFAGEDMLGLLGDHPRLLITRTLSKAAGLAGLRMGYCLGAPPLVEQISKAKLPYNVNIFSLTAAEILFEVPDLLKGHVDVLIRERNRLFEELRKIPGVKAYRSQANFIFFRVDRDPQDLFRRLVEKGILIRDVSRYPMLSRGLRVSVGTPQENGRFLEAISEIMIE